MWQGDGSILSALRGATPYIHGYNRENSYQVASVVVAQDAIIYDIEKPLVPVGKNTLIFRI